GGMERWLGRLRGDRDQGADRRWIAGLVAGRPRRCSAVLAALRTGHARVSWRHLSARAADGITGFRLNPRSRAAGLMATASAMTRGATWTLTTTSIFGTRFTASRRDIGTRSIATAGTARLNITCPTAWWGGATIGLRDGKKFENSTRGVNARPRPPSAA